MSQSEVDFHEAPRGSGEPGYGLLTPTRDPLESPFSLAAGQATAHIFGADFYHSNLTLVPAQKLKAAGLGFVILKVSQGTSYPWATSWFPQNARALRSVGLPMGGYHMLSGTSGTGAEQAAYFLSHYRPQPGDVVPSMDFEASGRGSASIATYRAKGIDFVRAVHAAGFPVMIYGHADVKAAFSDWQDSGADYWWQPGDQIHNDIGPKGPDLWQYGPYTAPAGYPTDPAGIGRSDMSVVVTRLPLVPLAHKPPRFRTRVIVRKTDGHYTNALSIRQAARLVRRELSAAKGQVGHDGTPATVRASLHRFGDSGGK